jgi:hypothetical protein
VHRRDEDDGQICEARKLADHVGQLEPTNSRHAHVDEHHRYFDLQKDLQCLLRRMSLNQVSAEIAEDCLIAQKLTG